MVDDRTRAIVGGNEVGEVAVIGSTGKPLLNNDEGILQIGSTLSKFTDGFNGNTIDLTKWDIVRQTGIVPVVAGGTLTIPMGTAANNELLMVGKQDVFMPANLIATLTISQRIAANEFRIGYLEVDDNGVPIAHASLPGQFRNYAAARLGNTASSTVVNLDTMSTDAAAVKVGTATAVGATSTLIDHSLEVRAEDVTYASQAADTVGARISTSARISSQVPGPSRRYRPFIWARNNAVATATSVVISRFVSLDLQEIQVEVGGGRGNQAASQALPISIVASNTTLISIPVASANGTSGTQELRHKRLSTADTNLVSVKVGAGRLLGGLLTNLGASTRYFKLYSKASAPVVATDVPILTIPIRAGSELMLAEIVSQYASYYNAGIAYAITGAFADTDATAIAAGDVVVNMLYI